MQFKAVGYNEAKGEKLKIFEENKAAFESLGSKKK